MKAVFDSQREFYVVTAGYRQLQTVHLHSNEGVPFFA